MLLAPSPSITSLPSSSTEPQNPEFTPSLLYALPTQSDEPLTKILDSIDSHTIDPYLDEVTHEFVKRGWWDAMWRIGKWHHRG